MFAFDNNVAGSTSNKLEYLLNSEENALMIPFLVLGYYKWTKIIPQIACNRIQTIHT